MKLFKKLLSYIIAFTMVLSLATLLGGNVHAADATEATTYTLTLQNNGRTTHTFEVYQIFTGDLNDSTLSNIQWGNGIKKNDQEALGDAATKAGTLAGKADDSTEAKAFAEEVQSHLATDKKVSVEVEANSHKDVGGLAAGYYLVKDEANSQNGVKEGATTSYILEVVKNTTATTKLDVPTVTKKVKDTNDSTGESSGWQDSADADINDDVQYQITGTMPANIADYTSYKYVFTDTMSKGLTYDGTAATEKEAAKRGNATIKIGKTDSNGSFNADKVVTTSFAESVTNNADGTTTVTWTCDDLTQAGVKLTPTTKVVVTYSAKLNKDAVIGGTGNPNTVNLTYSNNPNNGGDGETGKTPDDKNVVFTYKTVVNKVDQDKKSLAGAGFTLQKLVKKDGKTEYKDVKTYTAGEETTFEFTGLDDGDYKLIESTTPAGYNTIAPIEFKISATHDETADEPALKTLTGDKTSGEATFTADKTAGSLTTNVVNKKGSILPSTGGMGTTLLYVAGGILVACAAAYVVLNKKRA